MAAEMVLASQNSFRFPPGAISLDRNNFYTGPPKKPTASSRHRASTAPEERPTSKSKSTTKKERSLTPTMKMAKFLGFLHSGDEVEHIDRNPNHLQVAEGSSQANPVVIEDNSEADLDLETEGDEAGDEASGCVEPLELDDRYDGSDDELPSLQEVLQHPVIHNNTKPAAPDSNQMGNPAKKLDVATTRWSRQRLGTSAAADQEPLGAEKAESLNTDNPPVGTESDGEKAKMGSEMLIRKRKLDQLKRLNDVDYDSDPSTKESSEGGEGLRPRKQRKPHAFRKNSPPGLPIIDLNSQLPHHGTDHDSGDDEHNNSDGNGNNDDERALSAAWSASPSHQKSTYLREIGLPHDKVGNGGHDQNLDDPVNNFTAEEEDGGEDDSNDGDEDEDEDEDEDSCNDCEDDKDDDSDDERDKGRRYAKRQRPSTSPIRGDSAPKRTAKHHVQHCRRSTSTSFVHESDWSTTHISNHHKPLALPGLSLTDSLSDFDGAEEWPIQGFLRHKENGSFTIELRLDHRHHQLPSLVSSVKQSQKPRPKSRFTEAEDALLIKLKKENLPWEQIGRRFPGRTVGSLQVRYCTKLKSRAAVAKKRR